MPLPETLAYARVVLHAAHRCVLEDAKYHTQNAKYAWDVCLFLFIVRARVCFCRAGSVRACARAGGAVAAVLLLVPLGAARGPDSMAPLPGSLNVIIIGDYVRGARARGCIRAAHVLRAVSLFS